MGEMLPGGGQSPEKYRENNVMSDVDRALNIQKSCADDKRV